MALKKETVETFFNISQQHADAQKTIRYDNQLEEQTLIKTIKNPLPKKEETVSNPLPTQTQHNHHTNRTQKPHNSNTNHIQSLDNKDTQSHTISNTNPTQTPHNHSPNEQKNPSSYILYGNLKKLMIYIYTQCKFKGTHEIIVSINDISMNAQIVIGSVNTTLIRLEKKGLIKRIACQGGRGGWKKIKINESKYQEMLYTETLYKPSTNPAHNPYKPHTETNTQPYTTAPSSSSNYINTTTREEQSSDEFRSQLSTEGLNLDIEPLAFIGFTKTHLSQIASQNKLSTQIVQDSIYSFAFDLEKNDKAKSIKGDPINFFMGILRKGEPYVAPSNYESPQDKAMRLYMERKKKIEQGRADIEKESKDLAYREWFLKLTDEQKRQFLPENLRRNANIEKNKFLEGGAKVYFETEVWPGKKKEIEQEANITEYTEQGEVIEEKE